ncbi:outer membrane protein assembly factor BamD [Labilibacter marinus]|uniref:hypothetical protein n=1 Tax=Labilibacter marinus TaxID=1477105 RepID=UPI000830E369|nr:hypothetical protein [Labilibacter marinus]
MRLFKGLIVLGVALGMLVACSPLKKIEGSKTAALATYAGQDYDRAYIQLSEVINQYKAAKMAVPNDIYLKAADCALNIKNYVGASDYFMSALSDSVTLDGVKGYINSVKAQGKQEKTSVVIEKYADFLNNAGASNYVSTEQFDIALASKDDNKVIETYSALTSPNENQSMAYVSSLDALGKKKEAIDYCNKLVKENTDYNLAKEWKAVYYYNKAEEVYKSKMANYNKNKTYTAYVYLKRDLKKVSSDYRVAKDLFEDLRKVSPEEKKYIRYLKNIYLRLEMKREASAMDKLLK